MTATAVRALWRLEWIEALEEDESGDMILHHLPDGARLRIRNGRLARGDGYAEASPATRRALARAGAIVRLRERRRYHLHAAGVVDPAGAAWILTGASGSGKSTMAYALSRCGWSVLGDDGVVLEERQGETIVHAWRDPLHVSTQLAPYFRELSESNIRPAPADERRRVAVWPREATIAPLRAIIFLERAEDDRAVRLQAHEALVGLVQQCPWVLLNDAHSRPQLETLRRIAEHVPVLRVHHSARQLHEIAATLQRAVA
jgi:predicted ATPase